MFQIKIEFYPASLLLQYENDKNIDFNHHTDIDESSHGSETLDVQNVWRCDLRIK